MIEQVKKGSLIGQYVLGIVLAIYTYFFYFVLPTVTTIYDGILNVTFMSFLIFIFVAAYFFTGNVKTYIKEQRHLLILLLVWFLVTFVGYYVKGIFIDQPQYYAFLGRNFYYLSLMILFVAFVDRKAVDTIMVGMYAVYFLYGIKALPNLVQAQFFGGTAVANKNVIGFFLVPFLAYMLVKMKKHKWWAITWYAFGVILLYLTGARASFIAFFLLPAFIFSIKGFKNHLRLFYGVYLFLGMLAVLVITFMIYPNNPRINTFFTERVLLWNEYIRYVFETNAVLVGTGQAVLPDLLARIGLRETLHPHNQFVTMFVFNGIIGLFFFILFIVLAVSRKITRLLPSDAVLFTIVTILLAEALIPLFDFFFLSFVFIMNILINRALHSELTD